MSRIILLPLSLLLPATALAEGSTELGVQALEDGSVVYVDIIDDSSETVSYLGQGRIQVTGPSGADLGLYASGDTWVPSKGPGVYQVEFLAAQDEAWDLTVNGAGAGLGRVFAYEWRLDAGDYSEDRAFNGSFYVLVEAGGPDFTNVIEMNASGLAGYQWTMVANGTGVDGADGRSLSSIEGDVSPVDPIYLNPPEVAKHDLREPQVGELTLVGGVTECSALAPGSTTGTFTFDSDVDGSFRITCDLDGDGTYDISSDDDLTISGEAVAGTNVVEWDGTDNGGSNAQPGKYDCIVTVTVGEFHFVADDIETSFDGLRMFKVDRDLNRAPLAMFWNDEAVQDKANPMPNGEKGLMTSGPDGISSGAYSDATSPNRNARSWGSFEESGKGNVSLLDTFVWLAATSSGKVDVSIIDPTLDTDGDGISDIDELCVDGTDPYEVAGYFKGGCSTAPARSTGVAFLLGLLGLVGLRRRR